MRVFFFNISKRLSSLGSKKMLLNNIILLLVLIHHEETLSLSSRHRPGDSFEIKAAIHRTILLFVLRKWKCSLDVLFDGRTPEISLLIRMVKNEFDN